jgi:hypothetical protein
VLYVILKSLIISGIAGRSIVSPYMVMRSEEPKIASVSHVFFGIFCTEEVEDGFGLG